jgi:hypothetical protein
MIVISDELDIVIAFLGTNGMVISKAYISTGTNSFARGR